MPGEDMVLYSNPHWWYFWKDAVAGLVFLGFLILLMMADDGWVNDGLGWLTLIAFIVFVVMTVYARSSSGARRSSRSPPSGSRIRAASSAGAACRSR